MRLINGKTNEVKNIPRGSRKMIDYTVETERTVVPVPHCPFCNGEMNYFGDYLEKSDFREHDLKVAECWLYYSRFTCSKCGFNTRFRATELEDFVTKNTGRKWKK